jgi:hypothetical protein
MIAGRDRAAVRRHENSGPSARQGRDPSKTERSASGECSSLGADVRTPNGVPSQRCFSSRDRAEVRQSRERRATTNGPEVDCLVSSLAVAEGDPNEAGGRSGAGRYETGRLCNGRRAARGARGADDRAACARRVARPSDIRQDVRCRLPPLGLSPHGPSLKTVWSLKVKGRRSKVKS